MSEQETKPRGVQHADFFAALAAPFDPDEVKTRNLGGRTIYYVTARTVMNRLDDVCGPDGWRPRYTVNDHSVQCELSIRLPDGEWAAKPDVGGNAGMQDSGDDEKSGVSDALKRAAVAWGPGRYLYGDGVPRFVCDVLGIQPHDFTVEGIARMMNRPLPTASGGGYQSSPPPRPNHNGNGGGRQSPPPAQRNGNGRQQGGNFGTDLGNMPRDGRGLFAWSKKRQEMGFQNALKDVSAIGKGMGLPDRMVDWNGDDVAAVWGVVTGSGGSGGPSPGEVRDDEDIAF